MCLGHPGPRARQLFNAQSSELLLRMIDLVYKSASHSRLQLQRKRLYGFPTGPWDSKRCRKTSWPAQISHFLNSLWSGSGPRLSSS